MTQQLRRSPAGPASASNEPIAFDDAPRRGEDQSPGQIGGRIRQHIRRIRDNQSASVGGIQVDVVIAHGVVGQNPQPGGRFDQAGVDPVRKGHDGGDGPTQSFPQR